MAAVLAKSGTKGMRFALVDCFPEVLDILHQVNCTVGQTLGGLAIGKYPNKVQDRLVLPCGYA